MWSELNDWRARAHRLVPPADRRVLFCPPRLVARFARFAVRRWMGSAGQDVADDTHVRDPELVALLCDLWRMLGRYYFRLRVEGVHHVPPSGPVLFVGNHSGGFFPSEAFFTALAVHERYGIDRAVYALAHDFLFEDPLLRRYAGRLGILRAGYASAHHAFSSGGCVLVYPGSDLDTFRPFRERNRIVLGGRKGFLVLAEREGVPIIPVVTAGTHEQLIVLWRGERLARALHAHEWARTEVLPIVLSLPWGLTTGFLPYLPLPAQTSLSFLPPMRWPETVSLEQRYHEVESAMQSELDRLTHGRRFLLGAATPPTTTDTFDERREPRGRRERVERAPSGEPQWISP
jgi:1-acyl-sn-glycerol-3-phosphate acyltransferase